MSGPRPGALRAELARYFAENRKLVEADALDLLLDATEPVLLSRRLIDATGQAQPIVTRRMVEEALHATRSTARLAPAAPAAPTGPPVAFQLLSEGFSDVPIGQHALQGYGSLFASRFRQIQRMLRGKPELTNLTTAKDLRQREGNSALIAMIRSVRQTTEHKHLLLEVEDESGSIEVLVPRDRNAARQSWLPDEIVGLSVQRSRDRGRLPIVRDIVRPDVPALRAGRRSDGPRRVMFLSDLHLGSKSFLSESWAELVAFLRGEGPRPEIAAEIAHVVVAGDLVDGIGIYPNQERDLALHDIFEQYRELGRRLRELPDRLNVVILPGNHDAVCPAEPQPALPPEIRAGFPDNVRSVGNPSTFALDGVVVEAYHGRSFDDLIPAIAGASYARPTEVMKTMLAMRHLAPIYGGRTPLAPLSRDGFVVDPVPDILVTGHAHTYGVDQYRGVLLLNASTWQAETAYQKMRNITPVPARAAVVNLADLTLDTFDFEGPRPTATPGAPT
ncbi:MAG TPA: DNA-directed DNA polymerase II small subunit [Thermoplasmata archaeon]|nr:DNA-directed DNA polymerase II small subunit [Thermoplasmata archaeon]